MSNPWRDVDFFLRIHGHLPDQICGRSDIVFGGCEYRKDGIPINAANDYVERLRTTPEYLEQERAVQEAQTAGKSIRIKRSLTMKQKIHIMERALSIKDLT